LELLRQKISSKFVLPEKKIIDYKESLIFALLGILRIRNEVNVLSAATGAIHDSIGGFIYRM
jgi:anhydro-N-acetylmuramic acid kinase